jgi:DNA-binding NarL/FixJ family response regulator/signal transduction histidine kinase
MIGYTFRTGGPVVSTDVIHDPRFTISRFFAGHRPQSGMTVLIAGRDAPAGVLGAFTRERRAFGADDVSFLQAIANVLAAAVERNRVEARIIAVREAERRRIARDLHDEGLAHLTSVLARASLEPDRRAEPLLPPLMRVGEQLRAAIYDLRLAGEEERPFPELLGELVRVHRAMANGYELTLELGEGTPRGPLGGRGTEVLRVLGEALTNARRHAEPRRIDVRVQAPGGRFRAEVHDDGRGFDPLVPPPASAAGIVGMHERAALLNGRLDIASALGAGTQARLEFDLRPDDAAATETMRVLLVDDHATVRRAIASALGRDGGFEVAGQVGSLAEARRMLAGVDVAIVALRLPDGSGADLIPELRRLNRRAHALVFGATLDRGELARAVEKGAAGALNKTADVEEIVAAVRRLRNGETLLPLDEVLELLRTAARDRAREHEDRQAIARLTRRELDVLQALADGLDARAMAAHFHISVRTQRNHVANILGKLGAHSQLQALVFALRYDLVQVKPEVGGRR